MISQVSGIYKTKNKKPKAVDFKEVENRIMDPVK